MIMNTLLSTAPANSARPACRPALLVWLCLGLAALPWLTGCVSTHQTEGWLSQSGFKAVPADNAQRLAALKSLPAHKVSLAKRNGKTYYVFPDAKHNLLYVGDAAAYAAYKQLVAAQVAATEARATQWADDPNYVVAQDFVDNWAGQWPLE